ncbi:C40 family peptidase [Alicyclobacillus fodiniaquatilis]|jgi:cell wall-associated NlpC family hydrolase|uniref:C40 family peptidase n=1 Tax=Alicyclobacillus fodiniaquatilis TaxID=1661150 RepID=A0ABW4JI53_9BACL
MKKFVLTVGSLLLSAAPFVGIAQTAYADTQSYVETQHGWVDYHQSASINSPITGRLNLGDKAVLVGKANSYWYEISINGTDAYITTNTKYTKVVDATTSSSGGTSQSTGTTGASTTTSSGSTSTDVTYVQTKQGWVSYHSKAALSSPVIGKLQLGQQAVLVKQANSAWYEISFNGQVGYITTNSKYVTVTNQSNGDEGVNFPAGTSSTPSDWKTEADAVIAAAKSQLGVPYLWGNQIPGVGFDCSNFVEWSYHTGIGVTFSTSSEYQRDNVGTPVALSDIREGDLLFFKTSTNATGGGHVGIYLGNGQVIQEGGGEGKVTIETLATTWFGKNLVFARRIIQ